MTVDLTGELTVDLTMRTDSWLDRTDSWLNKNWQLILRIDRSDSWLNRRTNSWPDNENWQLTWQDNWLDNENKLKIHNVPDNVLETTMYWPTIERPTLVLGADGCANCGIQMDFPASYKSFLSIWSPPFSGIQPEQIVWLVTIEMDSTPSLLETDFP